MIPVSLQAGLWGTVASLALVLGALGGFYLRLPQRVIAGMTAFGRRDPYQMRPQG